MVQTRFLMDNDLTPRRLISFALTFSQPFERQSYSDEQTGEILVPKKLHLGTRVVGTALNITENELTLDLGSDRSGSIPTSALPADMNLDPGHIVGTRVLAEVTAIDGEAIELSALGLENTHVNAWHFVQNLIRVGEATLGRVSLVLRSGAFVEITPHIGGFLSLPHAESQLQIGEQLAVVPIELNARCKVLELGLPDSNWTSTVVHRKPGDFVHCTVIGADVLRVYVRTDEGVIGELPFGSLNKTESTVLRTGILCNGSRLAAAVAHFDLRSQRVILSMKVLRPLC